MEEVNDPFEGSAGYPTGGVVGEYFFSPRHDGVNDFAVFGDMAGGIEIGEPSQLPIRPVEVFGFIQLVELWGSILGGSEPWMSVEEPIQVGPVGVCEMIRSA